MFCRLQLVCVFVCVCVSVGGWGCVVDDDVVNYCVVRSSDPYMTMVMNVVRTFLAASNSQDMVLVIFSSVAQAGDINKVEVLGYRVSKSV